MAIGDKIDWRAGTIDPTTLQLIASAGAAQGAMYQSLGESVSKAFEKDSEDYIVAAGKAFDKANKLLEREDDEDFNKEKHEKLIKKGVNLFRKAGEKYNIISGGWESGSRLMTEEDIYKFYGFDPSKPPRRVPVDLPPGTEGPKEEAIAGAIDTDWRPTSVEIGVPPLSKTPSRSAIADEIGAAYPGMVPIDSSFGSASKKLGRIAEEGINPLPLLRHDFGVPSTGELLRKGIDFVSQGGQVLPSPRNTLGIDQGLGVSLGYTPYHRSGEVSGQELANMGAQAVIAQTPKAEAVSNMLDPISQTDSSAGHDVYDSSREMNIGEDWINPKTEGVRGIGDFIEGVGGFIKGGANKALDFVQYIGGFGKYSDLGPATFTPTGETLNEGFDQTNPFNPTLDSIENLETSYGAEEQLYFNAEDGTVNYGRRGKDGKPLIDYELIPREIR
jgi:hypothetical protein